MTLNQSAPPASAKSAKQLVLASIGVNLLFTSAACFALVIEPAKTAFDLKPNIVCQAEKVKLKEPTKIEAIKLAMAKSGIKMSEKSGKSFGSEVLTGYAGGEPVNLPSDQAAKESAIRVASLAMSGMMISAYMAHEIGSEEGVGYSGSGYANYSKIMLERSILPGSDLAAGEADTLAEVSKKMRVASKQLGALYKIQPIRWYVLGHAYDDRTAILASENLLCSSSFSDEARKVVSAVAASVKLKKQK